MVVESNVRVEADVVVVSVKVDVDIVVRVAVVAVEDNNVVDVMVSVTVVAVAAGVLSCFCPLQEATKLTTKQRTLTPGGLRSGPLSKNFISSLARVLVSI